MDPGSIRGRVLAVVPKDRFLTPARIVAGAPAGALDGIAQAQVTGALRHLNRLGLLDTEEVPGTCWLKYKRRSLK